MRKRRKMITLEECVKQLVVTEPTLTSDQQFDFNEIGDLEVQVPICFRKLVRFLTGVLYSAACINVICC